MHFNKMFGGKPRQWCSTYIPENCNEYRQWRTTTQSSQSSVGVNSILKSVWVRHHDQAIDPTVYDCHKESISHWKSQFDQEMDYSIFADAASNTLQNIELFDFHCVPWKPFIVFLHLANFLHLLRYYWNAESHYLRHFSDIFM